MTFFNKSFPDKLPLTNVAIFDIETMGLDARFDASVPVYCICILLVEDEQKPRIIKYGNLDAGIDALEKLLERGIFLVAHNAKYDYSVLKKRGLKWNITPGVLSIGDTMLMAYLKDSNRQSGYSLDSLTGQKTDVVASFVEAGIIEYTISINEFWETDWSNNLAAIKAIADYCCDDLKATWSLYKQQVKWYNNNPSIKLVPTLAWLEFPMLECLSNLEVNGSHVNTKLLNDLSQKLTIEKTALEATIAASAGMLPQLQWNGETYVPVVKEYKNGAFKSKNNLVSFYLDPNGVVITKWQGHIPTENSGKIVYDYCPLISYNGSAATGHTFWLLDKVCPDVIETADTTKTGKPSLGKEFLSDIDEQLPDDLPLAMLIKVDKQLSMATGIGKHVQPDGRIHASYQYTRTRTTRLATNNPNLQNISRPGSPINGTDYGQMFRSVFSAAPGNVVMVADVDRIELCVLAWFLYKTLGDDSMLTTINTGADIHQSNADKWGLSRSVAKTVIFLLVYGGTPQLIFKRGIAKSLEEAEAMFESVNKGQPSIALLKQRVWKRLADNGFITNPFNGYGLYPEALSNRKWTRLKGERQSFNWLIQKTSRDLMHFLAISSLPAITAAGGKMVNLIHDELVIEVPLDNAEALKLQLNQVWQNRFDLLPGIKINGDWNIGNNWYEAK